MICVCQIEKNVYKLGTSDPHVPAATLKLWLATIYTPVIPNELEEWVSEIGRKEDVGADESDEEQNHGVADDSDDDKDGSKKKRRDKDGGEKKKPTTTSSSSSQADTVRSLLRRFFTYLPLINRHVFAAVIHMLAKLLESKNARRNMHTSYVRHTHTYLHTCICMMRVHCCQQ